MASTPIDPIFTHEFNVYCSTSIQLPVKILLSQLLVYTTEYMGFNAALATKQTMQSQKRREKSQNNSDTGGTTV